MRGLVQIPCIERNAQGALRALDAAIYARMTGGHHFVPIGKVMRAMKETGHDLPSIYKETAVGSTQTGSRYSAHHMNDPRKQKPGKDQDDGYAYEIQEEPGF